MRTGYVQSDICTTSTGQRTGQRMHWYDEADTRIASSAHIIGTTVASLHCSYWTKLAPLIQSYRPTDKKQPTGWFRHTAPILFRVQCSRRFLEIYPEIWHTCSIMSPCRSFNEWVFIFFRKIFRFLLFLGEIWVLRGPRMLGEKNFVNDSAGAYKTRMQNFRVYLLKNGVDLCALNGKNYDALL